MGQQHSIALGVKSRMALAAMLAGAMVSGVSLAGTPDAATATATASQQVNVAQLQQEIESLKGQVAQLKAKSDSNWLTQERTQQITQIVNSVLKDSKTRSQYLDNQLQAGYDGGFFIRTADKNFQFKFNGYFQYRYDYGAYEARDPSAYPAKTSFEPGAPSTADANGFGFRYARLIFSGNAFTPRLTYFIQSDFAGSNSNSGNFQTKDLWVAYKFAPWLQVKAGNYLEPFTHVEYISSGLEFVDFNSVEWPFDPVRAMGASVYGEPIKNTLTYEAMINNGANTNDNGIASQFGGANGLDNRFGFAARVQLSNGHMNDFSTEPDINDTQHLAWMLGLAFSYDSQNSTKGNLPNAQASDVIEGLSSISSPGFISPQALNGNIYRATADYQLHYRGFSLSPVVFYQQINDNGLPTSGNTESLSSYYGHSTFGQLAYYVQGGYFVIPHKLELAASFGQFFNLSQGQNNRMDAYEAGVNYYIFGDNVKLQADEIYIPRAAFTNQFSETLINTQNYVTEVQLQVKF
ncbi:MAG: hypothetical protein ACP5O7_04125 [Phycisphaerae bacterium]